MENINLEFDEEDMIALRMAINELPEKARKRIEARIIFQLQNSNKDKKNVSEPASS